MLRRLRRILGWVLAIGILGVLFIPVARNFVTVRSTLASPSPAPLVGGALLLAGYFIFRAALWYTLTQPLSPRPRFTVATRIWFLTEFSRYLPGNVWSFLGRSGAMKAEGVVLRSTAAILIREALTIVATAAVLLPVLVRFAGGDASPFRTTADFVGALGGVLAVGLLAPVRGWKDGALPRFRSRAISVLLGFAAWGAFGLGSAFVLVAFHAPVGIAELVFISVSSWLIGYVSLITPSGLGVREAAIQGYLHIGSGVATGVASAFALSSRVVLILVEVVLVLLALAVFPRSRAEASG